jgi:hypothetical protein
MRARKGAGRWLLAALLLGAAHSPCGGASAMRPEVRYFEMTPKLVPADRESTITIRPRFGHVRFEEGAAYEVRHVPADRGPLPGEPGEAPVRAKAENGVLRFSRYFADEQEHSLLVDRVVGDERRRVGDFRVYSLRDDLYRRRPYKGDMHMHSSYSDGVESPGYVAAACRRIGLDFMALTDHRRYAPSLEAQQAFRQAPVDLCIYPGEEVHPPNSPVHIVNFGGRFSVNERFADPAALQEVEAIAAGLPELPPGVDRYYYASAVWSFDRIREGGGLAIFCHPDWFSANRYDLPQPTAAYILDQQPFDAYELIGGYARSESFSNVRQVARYGELLAKGRPLPIVGVSDAHGCESGELFGWYYTVVFSPSTDLPDLVKSIKDTYSVAVEALTGEQVHVYGPLRLVGYTFFLLREVFPQHDQLCMQEGLLMLDLLAGRATATEELRLRQGDAARLYAGFWGEAASR